ncbi:MAG TPA: hypothetical protein VHE53_01420 [Patescibacteria group bacterium]|nr:hypothetical protein [Patescibacteria group bacterium]
MNKIDIKKLARLTAQSKKVDKKVADFILKMPRRDLALYLSYLKNSLNKTTVYVTSNIAVPTALKKTLIKEFSDKEVLFGIDKSIKDGIKVVNNDTVIDLSMNGYLDKTIGSLKQEL